MLNYREYSFGRGGAEVITLGRPHSLPGERPTFLGRSEQRTSVSNRRPCNHLPPALHISNRPLPGHFFREWRCFYGYLAGRPCPSALLTDHANRLPLFLHRLHRTYLSLCTLTRGAGSDGFRGCMCCLLFSRLKKALCYSRESCQVRQHLDRTPRP